MSVAAELNLQTGPGRVLQVGGHDLGRAPVEGERGNHHPAVAHRHQVGLTGRILLLEQRNRVGAISGRLPAGVCRGSRQFPCFLPFARRSSMLGCAILVTLMIANLLAEALFRGLTTDGFGAAPALAGAAPILGSD